MDFDDFDRLPANLRCQLVYSMKLSKSSALRDRLGVSRVLGETVLNFNELWKASKSKNRGWNVGVRIGMGMMSILSKFDRRNR